MDTTTSSPDEWAWAQTLSPFFKCAALDDSNGTPDSLA